MGDATLAELILSEGRGVGDQPMAVLDLGNNPRQGPSFPFPAQLNRSGACCMVGANAAFSTVAQRAVGRHIVRGEPQATGRAPADAGSGSEIFVVSRRRAIQAEHIQDRVAGVNAGPDRQHVLLAHLWTKGESDVLSDRKGIKQFVDGNLVGSTIGLIGGFQGGQAAGPPAAKGCFTTEVACPQGGREQILAAETGLQDQLKVVVERGGAEALVVLIRQRSGRS